jgi:hypothetical protein
MGEREIALGMLKWLDRLRTGEPSATQASAAKFGDGAQ